MMPVCETRSQTNNIVALKGPFLKSAYATADCGRLLFGLLRQYRLNVRQYASLGDRHAAKELVQLLVVAYRELKMSGDDPGLLVVARRVTGQLEHLGGEIFHNGGQVDRSTGADALRIVTLAQQPEYGRRGFSVNYDKTVFYTDSRSPSGGSRARNGYGWGYARGVRCDARVRRGSSRPAGRRQDIDDEKKISL
ncbi:hypothetical protein EVAR_38912_1 [Eumeta japonica]|uniref:Uncharacterized protein n=1 Tax=Eumeta variegata TaxID=151549 RepID=A0A4C1ZNF7_EUMVA|nr:hypothetical protein EVAR_38912_1 [Eumeta japonica]